MEMVAARRADGIMSVGGGSTIGLGKAIALRTGLPQIVVPTTYAGSEMTPILGETKGSIKTTQHSPKILPETVLYDADLTLGLLVSLSVTSGINAIAHAVEALYAADRNPIISLMAEEGSRRSPARCPGSSPPRTTKRRVHMRFMGLGCAAPAWEPFRWHCIISSATPLGAPWTCPTRRRTRSCCRMPSPPTPPVRQRRWRGSRVPSALPTARRRCSTWLEGSAPSALCETWECWKAASTAPPTSPRRIRIRTPGRLSGTRMLRAQGRHHPYRPGHVHFMIGAPGCEQLITHVFVEGDEYLDSDVVFGVKDSLIRPFGERPAGAAPDGTHVDRAYRHLHYDFALAPTRA
jgi:hypothetical protein